MFNFIFLALFILSCGTDDSVKLVNEDVPKDLPTEKIEEEKQDTKNYPMALQTSEDLSECSEENESQLIYLILDKMFMTCSKNEWVEIDINGKDGVNGYNGSNGSNGTNGIDGSDGLAGKDGVDSPTEKWIYTDTNQNLKFQVVGYFKYQNYAGKYATICSDPYRLPTVPEFQSAVESGMIHYFNSLDFMMYGIPNQDDLHVLKYWLKDTVNSDTVYYNDISNNSVNYDQNAQITISSGFGVCIKI